jgi:hypothetical protein
MYSQYRVGLGGMFDMCLPVTFTAETNKIYGLKKMIPVHFYSLLITELDDLLPRSLFLFSLKAGPCLAHFL